MGLSAKIPPVFSAHGAPSKKQLAAHAAAREALPRTTQGQAYRTACVRLVALRAEGYEYWKRMHDLLEGEFGSGPDSYEAKSAFGYDRRLRGEGANRKKRVTDPAPVVVPAQETPPAPAPK